MDDLDELDELIAEVGGLRARVEALEAVLAIQALKAAYADLVDRRFAKGHVVDAPALDQVVADTLELFTADAVWDGGPVLGQAVGRAAIAERLRTPTLVFARHLFMKPRIEVELPRATGRWDLLCPCRTPDGRSWWMCGYEDDEYRLEDGVWRHMSMRLTTVFMVEAGEEFDRVLI